MNTLKGALIIFFSLLLVACEETSDGLDYEMFRSNIYTSYDEVENITPNRYIVYYYSETCSHCNDVKQEILSFFKTYEGLDFYLMNVASKDVNDSSQFSEFRGTPSLFIIAQGAVVETYVGTTQVRAFIDEYSNKTLTYDSFVSQHVQSFDFLATKEDKDYLIYYYQDDCENCESIQEDILNFAFNRAPDEIIFINKSSLDPEISIPEPFNTMDTLPVLLEVSYDTVMNTYTGAVDVKNYIITHQGSALDFESSRLEYDDFSNHYLTDYSETLVVDDQTHIEYFYSPYCSHCESLKQEILTFFTNLEDYPFYLVDISQTTGENTIEELTGVPTLIVVTNHQIEEIFSGTEAIRNFINSVTSE
ncbi:MAG: thioredoxin family protein [Candidatus Izemoplasma sp.]|nr:thioredoxin family protein [Candidatus Izemoplasma sp.]